MWNFLFSLLVLAAFAYLLALIVLPSRFTRRIIPYKTAAKIAVNIATRIKRSPKAQESLYSVLGFVLLIGAFVLIGAGWEYWDDSGYHPHTVETFISASSDWLEGESKQCSSKPVGSDMATAMKVPHYSVTSSVICDNGDLHQIKVTFWGRTTRPERRAQDGVTWKCTKKPGEFVCYALD
jgi:hypothetical protein